MEHNKFDIFEWRNKLEDLIDEVVETKDQEVAIEAIYHYDIARKRIDKMQAVPPSRRDI